MKDIEKGLVIVKDNDISHIDYNVVQSNNLVEGFYGLTPAEHKVIFSVISQVKQNDDESSRWFRFSTKQICELCGFSAEQDQNNQTRLLMGMKDRLLSKRFKVHEVITENGKTKEAIGEYNWLQGIQYTKNTWIIGLNEKMMKYLVRLKKNFTSEKLKEITNYQTFLGIRLDMLFSMAFRKAVCKMSPQKALEYKLRYRIDIKTLRKMIDMERKYKEFGVFNFHILNPAFKDLDKQGFFKVEHEFEKDCDQKVVAIIFFVELGDNNPYKKSLEDKIKEDEKAKGLDANIKKLLKKKICLTDEEIASLDGIPTEEVIGMVKETKHEAVDGDYRSVFIKKLNRRNNPDAEDDTDEIWDNL